MKKNNAVLGLAFAVAFVLASAVAPDLAHANASGGVAPQLGSGISGIGATMKGLAGPIGLVLIMIGGLTWAFTRNEEGFKKIGQACLGLGVVVAAVPILNMFGVSAGLL